MPVTSSSKLCEKCGHDQSNRDSVFKGLDASFQDKGRFPHILARAGATGLLIAIFVVALGQFDGMRLPL
jgi:hypothetical protein